MIVVIGGQASGVGKTATVCGIIRKLRDHNWTAIKISPHRHGADAGASASVIEELSPGPRDTGRFLGAGAKRSFLVRAGRDIAGAAKFVQELADAGGNVIVESGRIAETVQPDVFFMVVDASVADWKRSLFRNLGRADAFIVVQRPGARSLTPGVLGRMSGKPRFAVTPPDYAPAGVCALVRARLLAASI